METRIMRLVSVTLGMMFLIAASARAQGDMDARYEQRFTQKPHAEQLADQYIGARAGDAGEQEIAKGYFLAGVKAFKSKDYQQALKHFAYSYRLDPTNKETREYLIQTRDILIDMGVLDMPRSREGQKLYEKRTDKETREKIDQLVQDGLRYYRRGELDRAEALFLQAKDVDPDDRQVWDLLKKTRDVRIARSMREVQDDIDVNNHSMLLEVANTWLDPSIPTDPDELYYSERANTVDPRDQLRKKASRQILSVVDFKEANIKDVLRYLSEQGSINIIIDEKALTAENETVTIYLKDIPLLEALRLILQSKGLAYRFDKGFIWVTTEKQLKNEAVALEIYDVQDLLGRLYDFPSVSIGPDKQQTVDEASGKDDKKKKKKKD